MRQTAHRLLVIILFLSASAVYAQLPQTWVSFVGDDINPCTFEQPCKTFQKAVDTTAPGGIVSVLDAGSYGSVAITKSITINGSEEYTALSHLATPTTPAGVFVNAPGANVIVRNLDINTNTNEYGIRIVAAANVSIENCRISKHSSVAISDERTAAGTLNVIGCEIRNGANGIRHYPSEWTANVITISNTNIIGRGLNGIDISRGGKALIYNTEIHNTGRGILVSASDVTLERCRLTNNPTAGIRITTGTVRLSETTITGGARAIWADSGANVRSFGSNRIHGNSITNGAGMTNIGTK